MKIGFITTLVLQVQLLLGGFALANLDGAHSGVALRGGISGGVAGKSWKGKLEGEKCKSARDAECAGDLKCGKRSQADQTYVCCKDTYVPLGWTTYLCVAEKQEGEKCKSTRDAECAGSLECGKRSKSDSTYVCCKDTFVPFGWTTDLCVAQNEGDRCGTTEDRECAGSLECGRRSKSDSTYVCCKDTYVWWFWDVCK